MPAGFIRRYTSDPGLAELLAIEGVVIIDREPPAALSGVGSGTVVVVGEYEDGPFEDPTELLSSTDLLTQFGGFGHTYAGVPANNPCARVRRADAALVDEFWNGNGFIALANKTFRRLLVCRVDTSVGEVTFERIACLSGNPGTTYDLEPSQTLVFDIGAGNLTAIFAAAVATRTSGVGAYPTGFVGGETMNVTIDEGTTQQIGPVDIVFQAADQTQMQVIARINTVLGYTAAVDAGGGLTNLNGRLRGTAGRVRINSLDAIVTAETGFTVGVNSGTGNVANIDQVTIAEVHAVVNAVSASVSVDRDANGNARICNTGTPLTGTILVDNTSTAVAFGFPTEITADAAVGVDGLIPAGTRVRNAGGTEWVTMRTIAVAADTAGPYAVPVRHALDDGTGLALGAGLIITMVDATTAGGFVADNPLPLTAALTEAQLDAAYVSAIDATIDVSFDPTRETNITVSARSSNAVRTRLRTNALDASANGSQGRVAVISPPLLTTRANARATASHPGVGVYRDDRVVYAFPGASTFLSVIAQRGLDGGDGFSADGIIDTHFDSWVASVMSRLPPEENPGQETDFLSQIVAIERNNADVQGMQIGDYRAFRAAGIAALRIDGGVAFIQSGVTSVDPTVSPNLRNIARRRMADFLQDSLARRLVSFSKKMNRPANRALVFGETNGFMAGLVSRDNPDLSRIEGYTLDAKSANTPDSLSLGIFRMVLKARLHSSMDVIVLDTTVGETVDITTSFETAA